VKPLTPAYLCFERNSRRQVVPGLVRRHPDLVANNLSQCAACLVHFLPQKHAVIVRAVAASPPIEAAAGAP
jgi:hypothetical protein